MNRVEGDLQIKLEVEKNTVTDAWCIGSMYRGYEQVLIEGNRLMPWSLHRVFAGSAVHLSFTLRL